jgi:release factor glutamine methyltransferase
VSSTSTANTRAGEAQELTLLEVLRRATGYLASHGASSARLDAELLLAHALGLRRLDLYLQFERLLGEPELAAYRALIGRRGAGEPVAYLLGHKEFMKLDFEVTPDVLVPNPDTEVLVLRAIAWAQERGGALRVADVGTGSGCVAVALAHYVPELELWASDDDPAALAVAERNLAAHDLAARVAVVLGDLLEPLPGDLDLVCANLPYLAEGSALPPEVLAQPRHALFAAEGGSALVRRLLREAPRHLSQGGLVLLEVDPGVADAVADELQSYASHRFHRDLQGHVRVLEAAVGVVLPPPRGGR